MVESHKSWNITCLIGKNISYPKLSRRFCLKTNPLTYQLRPIITRFSNLSKLAWFAKDWTVHLPQKFLKLALSKNTSIYYQLAHDHFPYERSFFCGVYLIFSPQNGRCLDRSTKRRPSWRAIRTSKDLSAELGAELGRSRFGCGFVDFYFYSSNL